MRYLDHLFSRDLVAKPDSEKKKNNYMIPTTSTLTKMEILSLLLKGSMKMKQDKKSTLYLIANGKIKLIVVHDGLVNPCPNLEPSITYQPYTTQNKHLS